MQHPPDIKICGVTSVADAQWCVSQGATSVGVNFVAASPRVVDVATARAIVLAVGARARVVAVVADLPIEALSRLREETGVSWLQLHGHEPDDVLAAVLPDAYRAVRLGSDADVARAIASGGDEVLVDASVAGALGGTGQQADWSLARRVAAARRTILAGGLSPENVAEAIAAVRPSGVDVASGVEVSGNPRKKDPERVAAFCRAARRGGA